VLPAVVVQAMAHGGSPLPVCVPVVVYVVVQVLYVPALVVVVPVQSVHPCFG
jgi:predicted transcriptional regulator